MIYLFYITALSGFIYFLLSKRTADGFLIAYISALIYFLPGFFGYVAEPYAPNLRNYVQIENKVYAIYISILALTWFAAIITDRITIRIKPIPKLEGERSRRADYILALFLVGLLAATAQGYNNTIWSDDKHAMMANLPYLHKYLVLYAAMAGVFFLKKKRYWFLAFCLAIIAWDVYVGFRGRAAFFMIAGFLVYTHSFGPIRLISKWRIGLICLIAAAFMFSYKGVYGNVKRGDYSQAAERFFSFDGLIASILSSEPFTIQATLNKIVRESYSLPYSHISDQVIAVFPFSRTLGHTMETFNDRFQPELFPDLSFGMAANWWAYWFSVLGWAGVAFSAIILVLGCILVNFLLRSKSDLISTMGAVVASIWLFYIHRNDIIFTFGHIAQICAIVMLSSVVVLFFCANCFGSRPGSVRNMPCVENS